MAKYEGIGLAAEALSKAFGDYFTKTLESEQRMPDIQAKMQQMGMAQRGEMTQQAGLPLQIAGQRQGLEKGALDIARGKSELAFLPEQARAQRAQFAQEAKRHGWEENDETFKTWQRNVEKYQNEQKMAQRKAVQDWFTQHPEGINNKNIEQLMGVMSKFEPEGLAKAAIAPFIHYNLMPDWLQEIWRDKGAYWKAMAGGKKVDPRITADYNKAMSTLAQEISQLESYSRALLQGTATKPRPGLETQAKVEARLQELRKKQKDTMLQYRIHTRLQDPTQMDHEDAATALEIWPSL